MCHEFRFQSLASCGESIFFNRNQKVIWNLRSYDGYGNENLTLKKYFALDLLCCYVGHVVRSSEYFRFLGTNGFHARAKNERFTAACLRCRQNLKYENFTPSFGRLRQQVKPKSGRHVKHNYFSSFNPSYH